MKEIINENLVNKLKQNKKHIIICIIISIVFTIVLMVPLFIFANRDYMSLFTILLTLISTLGASFVLFLFVASLMPLNQFIKLSIESLGSNKFLTKAQIIRINDKITHNRGVAVIEIKVMDLEENNKEYVFCVEQSFVDKFETGKTYSLLTYQSFICSYDEVI